MADIKVSALPAATDPTGVDLLGVQGGTSKKIARDVLVGAKPITYTGGDATIPYSLSGASIGHDSKNFNLTVQSSTVPDDPLKDNVVAMLGWNQSGGGGRENPADGMMAISWEQHWKQGSIAAFEWHVVTMGSDAVAHRPISLFLPKDGGAGSIAHIQTDKLQLKDYAGGVILQFEHLTKTCDTASGFCFRGANNSPLLKQFNAANSAYLPLPYYGTDDRIRVEAPLVVVGGTPAAGTYPNTFARIQATSMPASGVLLSLASSPVTGTTDVISAVGNATTEATYLFSNSSNTASARAVVNIRCGGTSASDPVLMFSVPGGAQWTMGIDNSASDQFVIGTGSPGSADRLIISTAGDVSIATVGTGLRVKEGSNAKQGIATLVGGTVTVANTSVTANSRIMLTAQNSGGTPGFLRVSARTAGTDFTILSSSGSDTSLVAYQIFEPA